MPHRLHFPISEKYVSDIVGRDVLSPIRVASLSHLGIDPEEFVKTFSPYFEELPWDPYDARRLRIEFLKQQFPKEEKEIQQLFKDYYLGNTELNTFEKWIHQLSKKKKKEFSDIQPWRRRSVCQFSCSEMEGKYIIQREKVEQFAQAVMGDDYRSLPRVFQESPSHHVEQSLFYRWILAVYKIMKEVRPKTKKITMVGHFMSVKARPKKPGDNSPEGAHEDGADYIVSALVVNRKNVKGGESQIIEKLDSGEKEIIFRHTLEPGEFIFQGDSKDEIIHGTDLWHHVTPFALDDEKLNEGWRDIIGFDINVEED